MSNHDSDYALTNEHSMFSFFQLSPMLDIISGKDKGEIFLLLVAQHSWVKKSGDSKYRL